MCTVSSVYVFRKCLRKKEDIVPEHHKNYAHELVSIRQENLPNALQSLHHISIKIVELQSFCNFWLISFSCYFSVFESSFWDLVLVFLTSNINIGIIF